MRNEILRKLKVTGLTRAKWFANKEDCASGNDITFTFNFLDL